MATKTKPGFYAVAKGRKPGIYTDWDECKAQVLNFNGAKYKKFANLFEAESWIDLNVGSDIARNVMNDFLASNPTYRQLTTTSFPPPDQDLLPAYPASPAASTSLRMPTAAETSDPARESTSIARETDGPLIVYCDGACKGNGQAGSVAGIGVWWGENDPRNICERCPGNQTNNRAELIAIIRVLETAPIDSRPLIIKSDSQYSINCLNAWLKGWKNNGWKNARGQPVLNDSLIRYADILIEERRDFAKQPVEFVKVLGHSGEVGNEGADRLANLGATRHPVPESDWEGLIRQVRARMSMVSPPLAVVRNPPSMLAPRQNELPPSISPAAIRAPSPPVATVVPKQPSPDSRTQNNNALALQSRRNTAQHDMSSLPAEELEIYASCLLSDDEFLLEAQKEGLC